MKKIISILISLMLFTSILCSLNFAYAKTETIAEGEFPIMFVSGVSKNSASQWMSTESNRALFAVLLSFDYLNKYQDDLDSAPYDMTSLLFGDVYVGQATNILLMAFKGNVRSDCIIMIYDTLDNATAIFSVHQAEDEDSVTSYIKSALNAACCDGYYQVEPLDLQKALNKIDEMGK